MVIYLIFFIVICLMFLIIYKASDREEQLKSKLLKYENATKQYLSARIQIKKPKETIKKDGIVLSKEEMIYYKLQYKPTAYYDDYDFYLSTNELQNEIKKVMKDVYQIEIETDDIKSASKTNIPLALIE
jgi:hypothetical protein